MNSAKPDFIPAAHWHFLTPFYHAFMRLFFGRQYLKIADMIMLQPNDQVLDVGCGPGQMLRLLRGAHPETSFTGLDVDPQMVAIAKKNLSDMVPVVTASAASIPFPDQQFSVVISTLMIHHLTSEDKQKMIREVHRILKPGGAFYLLDFARPVTVIGKILTAIFRKVESLDDAIAGNYARWMREAGFKEVAPLYRPNGMMELLRGTKI